MIHWCRLRVWDGWNWSGEINKNKRCEGWRENLFLNDTNGDSGNNADELLGSRRVCTRRPKVAVHTTSGWSGEERDEAQHVVCVLRSVFALLCISLDTTLKNISYDCFHFKQLKTLRFVLTVSKANRYQAEKGRILCSFCLVDFPYSLCRVLDSTNQ